MYILANQEKKHKEKQTRGKRTSSHSGSSLVPYRPYHPDKSGDAPNISKGTISVKTDPPKLFQEKPPYLAPYSGRWSRARGWKNIAGATFEADKLESYLDINEKLQGHPYTQALVIALKVELTQEQARPIYRTISLVLRKHKANYFWTQHTNRANHLDRHYIFSSDHDWGIIKADIRQAISKHHELQGREFEVHHHALGQGYFGYILRTKRKGFQHTSDGTAYPVKDYWASHRVLMTQECTLRHHGSSRGFWKQTMQEFNQQWKEARNAAIDNSNANYLEDKPDLAQDITNHVEQALAFPLEPGPLEQVKRPGQRKPQTKEEFYRDLTKAIRKGGYTTLQDYLDHLDANVNKTMERYPIRPFTHSDYEEIQEAKANLERVKWYDRKQWDPEATPNISKGTLSVTTGPFIDTPVASPYPDLITVYLPSCFPPGSITEPSTLSPEAMQHEPHENSPQEARHVEISGGAVFPDSDPQGSVKPEN